MSSGRTRSGRGASACSCISSYQEHCSARAYHGARRSCYAMHVVGFRYFLACCWNLPRPGLARRTGNVGYSRGHCLLLSCRRSDSTRGLISPGPQAAPHTGPAPDHGQETLSTLFLCRPRFANSPCLIPTRSKPSTPRHYFPPPLPAPSPSSPPSRRSRTPPSILRTAVSFPV